MKLKTVVGLALLAVASMSWAALVPGGDFELPNFSDGVPNEVFTDQGWWSYNQSANASSTVGDYNGDRCLRLNTGWYPRSATSWFTNEGVWALNNNIDQTFSVDIMSTNTLARTRVGIGSSSSNFLDIVELSFEGTACNWVLGSGASGSATVAALDATTWRTARIEYDVLTGTISAYLDEEVIFEDESADSLANVKSIGVTRLSQTYSNGYSYVDNVSVTSVAVPEPATMSLLAVGIAGFIARRKK